MSSEAIGVLGATSLIGESLIALLHGAKRQVHAFSRKPSPPGTEGLLWHHLSSPDSALRNPIEDWICLAPIWVVQEHFALLQSFGLRRIVAISSTSRFSKAQSNDATERATACRLLQGEQQLIQWAANTAVQWVILRPTMIYGFGRDKNIAQIARFIDKFGFFPLLGRASGLRQPIHVEDVARACLTALQSPAAVNRAYNISGKEIISYREMVRRVFSALHRPPRLLPIPCAVFRLGIAGMRRLPGYHHWSPAMAERMNSDLAFDHADAARDFGFSPRPFHPVLADLLPGGKTITRHS